MAVTAKLVDKVLFGDGAVRDQYLVALNAEAGADGGSGSAGAGVQGVGAVGGVLVAVDALTARAIAEGCGGPVGDDEGPDEQYQDRDASQWLFFMVKWKEFLLMLVTMVKAGKFFKFLKVFV